MNSCSSKKRGVPVLVLALSFGVLTPLPASASVVENCVGDNCTVTFSLSSEMQTFTPPKNAKNLTFEVSGAQGGKNGGGGGQVTGALRVIPEVLYVFVGGAGRTGNAAPGGFNGGGTSGSGSDTEGSGGGASDIRTAPGLSSRIVVAGGGGARGGGSGSGGGSGGGLVALTGRTGQGIGGTGGSQVSAGSGGGANGTGTAGLAGSLGVGGTGGNSVLYGGGGGGGGYFGGGGGGSDTDPCCFDAGGGGGGSSFTDEAWVADVVHSQGVWPGSGRIILRYQLAPVVTSIASEVLGNRVTFQIEFDKPVSGFDLSDLEINHSAGFCAGAVLAGSEPSYELLLTDCAEGSVLIAVKPDAVTSSEATGPIEKFTSLSVLIDTVAPTATWAETNSAGAALEFSEPITTLELEDLDFDSDTEACTLSSISQQSATNWQAATAGCEQISFTLSLRKLSVADASGNLGPATTISTSFVAEVPAPPMQEPPAQEPPAQEPPAQEPAAEPLPEPVSGPESEPESEPVLNEEPDQPVAIESEPEDREVTAPPTESVLREEPAEPIGLIQLPNFFEPPPPSESVVPEQKAPDADRFDRLTDIDRPADLSGISIDEEPAVSGIFTSPPANSLPQAQQAVIIPAQGVSSGFGSSGLIFGFLAIGLFVLGAGLVVARRGIPGVLSS